MDARGEPPAGADEGAGEDGACREIHYHFPVEVEVRTVIDHVDHDHIVTNTLRRLVEGLDST